jgi:DedD protein
LNTRYETDRDLQDLPGGQDREISLGTTTILGIFFALALLCAVFFGFGYSLGRKSAPPVTGPAAVTATPESSESKPSPGSPLTPATSRQAAGSQSAIVPVDSQDTTAQDSQPVPAPKPLRVDAASHLPVHAEPAASIATKPAALIPIAAAATSSGASVVQVAAMSHQEDADVVAVDLKRRGYAVVVRHEPQDKLFHVQIGPFNNRKEADAMRQRLQTDGYNSAIVK